MITLGAMRAVCLGVFFVLAPAPLIAAEPDLDRDGWYRWEVAAGASGRKACCYNFRNGTVQRVGCRLGDSGDGMVLNDDCDVYAGTMHVYVEIRDGRAREIQPLSSSCPVQTGSDVREVEAVTTADSIAWLMARVRDNPSIADEAVMALSFHAEEDALAALAALLEDRSQNMDAREQALFWMVQSGSDEAFAYLDRLLD